MSGDDYVIQNVTIPGGSQFKVASADWSTVNFGGVANMVANTEYVLTSGTNDNCSVKDDFTGNVKFNLATGKFKLEGQSTAVDPTTAKIYIRGDMNGWAAEDAWQFATTDGENFVLNNVTIEGGVEFKVADSSWGAINYGGASDIAPGTPYQLVLNGKNCTLAADFTGNVKFVLSTATITFEVAEDPVVPPTPGNAYTVKYDNGKTAWDAVYAYVWNGGDNNAAWPGVEMTLESGTVYTYTFEAAWTPEGIIFNDGNGQKTDDLEFENGKTYGEGDDPVVPPTPADGYVYLRGAMNDWAAVDAWKFTTADNDTYMLNNVTIEAGVEFKVADSAWGAINYGGVAEMAVNTPYELTFFSEGNCSLAADFTGNVKFVLSTATITFEVAEDPVVPPTPGNAYTVKYDNGKTAWDAVYAYVWNGGDNNAAWPGVEMTLESGTVYTYTFEAAWTPEGIIFNDGNGQKTDDLEFENGKTYGEGEDPVVPPTPADGYVYLRGAMNDWAAVDAWKFTTADNDTYMLNNVTIEAGVEFKVADSAWGAINYGGVAEMAVNTPYELTFFSEGNCSLAADFTGNVKFVLSTATITFEVAEDPVVPPTPGNAYTVKYDNGKTAWDAVYAYVWNGGDNNAAWPGVEMTLESGTVYTYTFEAAWTPEGIIFNDGNGQQTDDLEFENGKTYGEGEDPVVPPTPGDGNVYLRGAMNDWAAVDAWKFSTTDNENYVLNNVTIAAGVEFKIADNQWDAIDFGGEQDMVANNPYVLTPHSPINCTLAADFTGNVKFSLSTGTILFDDGQNPPTPPTPVTYPASLYMMGNVNGYDWATDKGVEAVGVDGVYTYSNVTVDEPGYFSFASVLGESWDVVNSGDRFGAVEADALAVIGTNDVVRYTAGESAGVCASWQVAAGQYKMVVDLVNMTLNVTLLSGIEAIEAAGEAPVYFNLQGVRVENPANGLYIVVRGNKVSKELVK